MAGSVEAFKILQGGDNPAKTTAKATTEMAAQMKKWDVKTVENEMREK